MKGIWIADTETRPPGCTLHRINNDDGYRPGNVQWADAKQQAQNRRPRRAKRAVVKRRRVEPPPLDDPPF
jgi:hypothetical protein